MLKVLLLFIAIPGASVTGIGASADTPRSGGVSSFFVDATKQLPPGTSIISRSAHEQQRTPVKETATQLNARDATTANTSINLMGVALLVVVIIHFAPPGNFLASNVFFHRTTYHEALFHSAIVPNAP